MNLSEVVHQVCYYFLCVSLQAKVALVSRDSQSVKEMLVSKLVSVAPV